ncbi:MAG: lasso peptide biosynthesis B2 protein [Pseudomonadota bacterium]
MQPSSCYLSNHAFFCFADNHYVFLDLRSDEYMCLGRAQSEEFKGMLSSGLDEESVIVQTLLEKGLFVTDEAAGKYPVPQKVESASTSLLTGAADKPRPAIGPAHVFRFFAACGTASWNLRWRSIEQTVRQVERRKNVKGRNAARSNGADIIELFAIFQALRPYYPRPYLCLFDSLALVHFLARFNIYPEWVYGVKLEPWGAHCWVQSEDLVVNDIVDNVNGYTPIMSI